MKIALIVVGTLVAMAVAFGLVMWLIGEIVSRGEAKRRAAMSEDERRQADYDSYKLAQMVRAAP